MPNLGEKYIGVGKMCTTFHVFFKSRICIRLWHKINNKTKLCAGSSLNLPLSGKKISSFLHTHNLCVLLFYTIKNFWVWVKVCVKIKVKFCACVRSKSMTQAQPQLVLSLSIGFIFRKHIKWISIDSFYLSGNYYCLRNFGMNF